MPSDYLWERVPLELEEFILDESDATDYENNENDPPDISDFDYERVEEPVTDWQLLKLRFKTYYINKPKLINDLIERILKNIFS